MWYAPFINSWQDMESKTCQKRFIVSSINSDLSVKNGSSSWGGSKHSEPTETKKKRILPRVPAKTGGKHRNAVWMMPSRGCRLSWHFFLTCGKPGSLRRRSNLLNRESLFSKDCKQCFVNGCLWGYPFSTTFEGKYC